MATKTIDEVWTPPSVSAEQFKRATGREPVDDDLERANCPKQGQLGHRSCGWCLYDNLPRFMCNHWYSVDGYA